MFSFPHSAPSAPPVAPAQASGSSESALNAALAAIDRAIAAEKDAEDEAELRKIAHAIQKVKADRQKERDDAMGLGSQHKFIRRQNQGY